MKRDTDKKITVEDLLRLKRSERPPVEFWATFEAEIRSKQLSAIVNKRPWWQGLSRAAVVLSRYQLPFGAAAALAVTWAGVRYYSAPSAQAVHLAPARSGSVTAAIAPAAVAPLTAAPVAETKVAARSETLAGAQAPASSGEPVVTATASHLTKAPLDITLSAISKSPFAEGIAVSLADYREPAADLSRQPVFGSDREFETTVAPATRQAASDPLARMDPAEERRARLLAPALPAYSSAARRALAIDWMKARSASDERMYESMDHESNDRMLVGFRF